MEANESENIINSLDGLQKAGPGPFFYTRVHARLQKEEAGVWSGLSSFLTKPQVALATLFLVFLLNAAVFFFQKHTSSVVIDQNEQTVNEDYNTTLAANSYYDENTDPR